MDGIHEMYSSILSTKSQHGSVGHHEAPGQHGRVVVQHVVCESDGAQLVADEAAEGDGLRADGHAQQRDVAEHARHDVDHLAHDHGEILQ